MKKNNTSKKVTVIYSGHQIDYLYGLLSGFHNKDIEVEVIDAIRKWLVYDPAKAAPDFQRSGTTIK